VKNPPKVMFQTWIAWRVKRRPWMTPEKQEGFSYLLEELGEVDAPTPSAALDALKKTFPLIARGDMMLQLKSARTPTLH